jgi:AcrR family transcriptional regulator
MAMATRAELSPRAARTRAALIEAGFQLLVERSIDAIPIDDVIAKAGVAKGSFFNHFTDKQSFAGAIATEVRLELEALVTQANAGIANPVQRIAGGMRVGAEFAIIHPKRTTVLLRSHASSTMRAHPLNQGLVRDFEAAQTHGLLRGEAAESGVLFWMGLCQVLMASLVERRPNRVAAERRISEMIVLGLTGLGVPDVRATEIANMHLEK